MTEAPSCVLDSSALLAFFQQERGAERVLEAMAHGAAVSAVNWAETLTKISASGRDLDDLAGVLGSAGIPGTVVRIVPLDERLAVEVAKLRAPTRRMGLSLGDRACLALGRSLALPILTADLAWSKLRVSGITIEIVR